MTTETSVDQKLGAFHVGSCSVAFICIARRTLAGLESQDSGGDDCVHLKINKSIRIWKEDAFKWH